MSDRNVQPTVLLLETHAHTHTRARICLSLDHTDARKDVHAPLSKHPLAHITDRYMYKHIKIQHNIHA